MLRRIPLSVGAVIGVILIVGLIGGLTYFASARIGSTVLEQFRSQQLQVLTSVGQQTEAYFGELTLEGIQLAQRSEVQANAGSRVDPSKASILTSLIENDRVDVVKSVSRFNINGTLLYTCNIETTVNSSGQTVYLCHEFENDADTVDYSIPAELVAQTENQDQENIFEFEPVLYRVRHNELNSVSFNLLILPVEADTSVTQYLVYELNMEAIFADILDFVVDDLRTTDSGQLWVFDYEGNVTFSADSGRADGHHTSLSEYSESEIAAKRNGEPEAEAFVENGIDHQGAFVPADILGRKFLLVRSQHTDEAQAAVSSDLRIILIIAIATVLLLAAGSWVGIRRIFAERTRREAESGMRQTARSLLEVSRALNSSLELQTVLDRILIELQNLIPYYSASILLLNEAGLLEVSAHRGEDKEVHEGGAFRVEEARAAREVIARGHPVIINDTINDERWTQLPNSETRSWIGLPLRIFDRSVGVLNINSNIPIRFTMQDLELAEAFSDQASVALQNARLHDREVTRIEEELTVARGIQSSLMPSTPPESLHLDIAFASTPARQVSGDFFQLIPLNNGRLAIFVGDVSGKGMPAALIMAIMNTTLRDEVTRQTDPAELLNVLNERLLDRLLQNQMNSAMVAAFFDPATQTLGIANAGMVQPYLRTVDNSDWDFVDVGGYPLGASQRANYYGTNIAFIAGSMLILFSDGIIEAQNLRGEFFGFERFEALLESMPPDIDAHTAVDQIMQATRHHIGEEDLQDDITVMVIRALEVVEPSKPKVLTSSSPSVELPMLHLDIPQRDNGSDHRIISTHPERIAQNEGLLMPRENVELFIPSRLGFEKIARNAASALATEMGFSPDRIEDLKTAVSEACMNAIEHGNLEDRATSVNVLLSASPDHLEVRVEDRGRQYIPNPLPPPGGVDKSRGWGMFFIQNLMDEVEITKLPEGGNIVKMTIYLGMEEPTDNDTVADEPSADASEWIEQNE